MRDAEGWHYRPIDSWPGEQTKHRRRANFSRGWASALRLMQRELEHLGATDVVIQVALREKDFRITDGHPRASAVADHPGVIVAFDSKYGPLKYATDTFTSFDDNFIGIALSLQRLRLVDEYGITKRGEQYKGWSQLPSGTVMGLPMSRDEALRVLCDLAGETVDRNSGVPANVDYLYRLAAKSHHPDNGGDADLFRRATEARDRLLEDS